MLFLHLSRLLCAQAAIREQNIMWYYYWHRLVGTAGAWFFWCGPTVTPNPSSTLCCHQQRCGVCSHAVAVCGSLSEVVLRALRCVGMVGACVFDLYELLRHAPLVFVHDWSEQLPQACMSLRHCVQHAESVL